MLVHTLVQDVVVAVDGDRITCHHVHILLPPIAHIVGGPPRLQLQNPLKFWTQFTKKLLKIYQETPEKITKKLLKILPRYVYCILYIDNLQEFCFEQQLTEWWLHITANLETNRSIISHIFFSKIGLRISSLIRGSLDAKKSKKYDDGKYDNFYYRWTDRQS